MSRPLRIEYSGAWYHVMHRGAGRRQIFTTDAQRAAFLGLLGDTHDRYRAEWHAYCLMGNHYHLLVRTPEPNLQRIMRHLNGVYTQYFNRTTRSDGPLFRGRYRAILVDAEPYMLQLSRYIHRNPLEAGLTARLDRYRWSSYPAYIGRTPPPAWLETRTVLEAIGVRDRRNAYRAYVLGTTEEEVDRLYAKQRWAPILGDAAFRAKVAPYATEGHDVPERQVLRRRPTATAIVRTVAAQYGVPPRELKVSRRGLAVRTPARALAMYLCQEVGGLTLAQIAAQFGLSGYGGAGAVTRLVRQRLAAEPALARTARQVARVLEARE